MAELSKTDQVIAQYSKDLKDIFGVTPDMSLLAAVTKWQGPNNFRRDHARVSSNDKTERERFLDKAKDTFDSAIADEIEPTFDQIISEYGTGNASKFRVVVYYLMTERLGQREKFTQTPSHTPTSNPPNASASNSGAGGAGDSNNQGAHNMPITFIDAQEKQRRSFLRLSKTYSDLADRAAKKSNLNPDEDKKLKHMIALLGDDPENPESTVSFGLENINVTLRQELGSVFLCENDEVPTLNEGVIDEVDAVADFTDRQLVFIAAWGALANEGVVAPKLDEGELDDQEEIAVAKPTPRFAQALTRAVADTNSHKDLYRKVLEVMTEADDVNTSGKVRAKDWVTVTRSLIAKGVGPNTPGLQGMIRRAIDDRLSPGKDDITSTAEIIIPDLEQSTAQEIQRVNLEAAQAIYFAAMMDEARIFDVVDKLAELFQIGALPLEKGQAGETLYRYIRNTPDRISPHERRNTYARIFGVAVGDPDAQGAQFRNFDDLWLRFVSAVSDWFRKRQVESLLATGGNLVPSQEQIRKSGLDLAANLSLYCYGGTWFVASELQKNISEYVDLLSSPEIKSLYGARDMWQVIDQVSMLEFGRPVNTIRARTMANAGATIIGWLEKKSDALSQTGSILINHADIATPPSRSSTSAINDPSDFDLVTACEQWLAVEGVGEDIVDVKAGAAPSAATQTAPVRIPPAAQDIMGAFGFSHQNGAPTHVNGQLNGRNVH